MTLLNWTGLYWTDTIVDCCFARGLSSARKLLLVNKENTAVDVSVDVALKGGKATAWFVDESYVTEASPRVELAVQGEVTLPPYATAVLVQS